MSSTPCFTGRLTPIWAKLMEVYIEFRSYRHQWRLLGLLMLQAILTQTLAMLSLYTLILAFDYAPPFGAFVAVTGIGTSLDLVPISLNSLGVREGVYVYFLGLLAVPAPVGAAFALSIRLMALIQALLGGLVFLGRSVHPVSRSAASASAPVVSPVIELEEELSHGVSVSAES